jgi:hypothetical protein
MMVIFSIETHRKLSLIGNTLESTKVPKEVMLGTFPWSPNINCVREMGGG